MKQEELLHAFGEVVKLLPKEFDSHEFIHKFIFNYPQRFGQLLIKHNNVTTAHGEIANYLRNNSCRLNIEQSLYKVYSNDIFGLQRFNTLWQKIN